MTDVQAAIRDFRAHQNEVLGELEAFARIPSISTLPEHKPDILRAADFVAAKMQDMGLENVEILPTGGHPVVYGEWRHAPGKPTVLVYGHYDVQPADPLEEWISPPFEPTVRGHNLYARGASDMKGQVMAFLQALAFSLNAGGGLGVNVRVLVEGEEEIGSPSLEAFLRENRQRLQCDFSLNADAGMTHPDLPSIVYGLRGLAYFELWVHGATHDLHSGVFGGIVHNPAQVLAELIAGMHDAEGRVTLPGYYDTVRVLPAEERAELARAPYSEQEDLSEAGNPPRLWGEKGYTSVERKGARPTLEVNGLYSGFIGEGSKTVLPAKAMAKLSMRLVPNQQPQQVEAQLRAYLEQHAPPTVTWTLKSLNHASPVLTPRDSAGVRALVAALETVFGTKPIFRLEGGSIPVVGQIREVLGVDSVVTGFGLPDDNLHAPNEKIHIPSFYRGVESYIHFFANL